MQGIVRQQHALTPKARILSNFILNNPRKAVFMTTKELAQACQVSEATVVRFVGQLGYNGYGAFQQALRDFVDTELTMLDRTDLSGMQLAGADRLSRVVFEEVENLKLFLETVDMAALKKMVDLIESSKCIYVIGSRLSYTFAYYLGWSLTKIRSNIHILKGSDSTAIDWLTNAPDNSLVTIITTSRYPNELIRIGKVARRLQHHLELVVVLQPVGVVAVAAVGGAAGGLGKGDVPGLGPQGPEECGGVVGAGAHLRVVGLHHQAAALRPKLLKRQNDVLEFHRFLMS